jgi:hypothetical protein
VLGILSLTFTRQVAVAHWHFSFRFQCSESAAKKIVKVLWVPKNLKVPIRESFLMLWCDCCMHHTGYNLLDSFGPKAIWTLMLLHYHSIGCTAECLSDSFLQPQLAMKMVEKSWINEAYSIMNFSILSMSFSLFHSLKSTCTGVRGNMQTQAAVHDGPWCPMKQYD